MYILIGHEDTHYDGSFVGSSEEVSFVDIVAKFTTLEKARDYIRKSKLSSYNENCCDLHQHSKQFREDSLLNGYCHAYIERDNDVAHIINPTIGDEL